MWGDVFFSSEQVSLEEGVQLDVLMGWFLSFHESKLSCLDNVDIRLAGNELIFEINDLVEAKIENVYISKKIIEFSFGKFSQVLKCMQGFDRLLNALFR